MISAQGIKINNEWFYAREGDTDKVKVNLPHSLKEVEYNYFDEKDYQIIGNYEKNLFVNQDVSRIFLKFEGVMTAFELYVNNQEVAKCRGGYIPHTIELTGWVQPGVDNRLLVKVDGTERMDIPPFGYVIDYLTFSGIYRDVMYYEMAKCFIENVFYKYEIEDIEANSGTVVVHPKVVIDNGDQVGQYTVAITLLGKCIERTLEVKLGKNTYELESIMINDVELWSVDTPMLHEVTTVLSKEGQVSDSSSMKLGFRKLHIDNTGVYINEQHIKLCGLNRHQSYPYVGYAMPKRVQQRDADILKYELNLNTVRTSHYPQSTDFLNRCDEIGLLVLEEIPGWQNISMMPEWRAQVLDDVRGMVTRDYNHPSIITWGVRINESLDDEQLYTKTNALARLLDNTRPTSGVRYLEKSQFLEDIYTMNDFIHEGGECILRTRAEVTGGQEIVPYLVTEFCGHVFPTKRFDCEERLIEHALRHGRVQSAARMGEDYLGAIGWCAFDYNTHYDFGSGDRICYHGVMDMNRMTKFAGHMYKSQVSPEKQVVIEPLTYWSRGERNCAMVFPIQVCTNCEAIDVVIDGISRGVFLRELQNITENLKGLEYPPICVQTPSGDWGSEWSNAEFIGLIDGQVVGVKKFVSNPVVTDLLVVSDDDVLLASELDATRIIVKVVDQVGNLLPYVQGAFTVDVEGELEVIGKKMLPVTGGCMAFWVKTKANGIKGQAIVNVTSSFDKHKQVKITLV